MDSVVVISQFTLVVVYFTVIGAMLGIAKE